MSQAGIEAIKKEIAALEQPPEIIARIAALKGDLKILIEHERKAITDATSAMLKDAAAPTKASDKPSVRTAILDLLHIGIVSFDVFKESLDDVNPKTITQTLSNLKREGKIVKRGDFWMLPTSEAGVITANDVEQANEHSRGYCAHDDADREREDA